MVRIIGTHELTPAPFEGEVHDMGDFVKAHLKIFGDEVKIISQGCYKAQSG
jgi:hypothetical protein